MGKSIAFLVLVGLVCALYFPVAGLHHETANGGHKGYVTAAERTGIFFKIFRVYLKTDTQSSQEDAYCVVDPTVYAELQKLSEQRAHVTVSYLSWQVARHQELRRGECGDFWGESHLPAVDLARSVWQPN